MQNILFRKNVSKGSKFNQIYIPKHLENEIEVGDEVEVKLIRKHVELFYSKGLKKLSQFKERLIKEVFSFLAGFDSVLDIFAVGSFLFRKVDYNDIDIVIISEKKTDDFDAQVYTQLIDKFNLNFHIMIIEKERFEHLLNVCPLTRAMFSSYVSNRKVSLDKERIIDKTHLRFLLMMPEDLLEVRLSDRAFFDNLRRLITIERFLDDKKLDLNEINFELKDLIGERLYERMRNNEQVEEKKIKEIRGIMRVKLERIKKRL